MLKNEDCLPLIAAFQAGDRRACDRLIRLVQPHFARVLSHRFRLRGDVIAECGPVIIWEAARRYDSSKGASFLTYACLWYRPVVREYQELSRGGFMDVPWAVRSAVTKYGRGQIDLDSVPSRARELIEHGTDYVFADKVEALEQGGPQSNWAADSLIKFNELAEVVDRAAVRAVPDPVKRRAVCSTFGGRFLNEAGADFGVCKERVRQLQVRIVANVTLDLAQLSM